LGIEIRTGRDDVVAALATLADTPTWLAVTAEREVSRSMGGSCSMPLAAHATFSGQTLEIRAAWGSPQGEHGLVQASAQATVTDAQVALQLGADVAQQLKQAIAAAGLQV